MKLLSNFVAFLFLGTAAAAVNESGKVEYNPAALAKLKEYCKPDSLPVYVPQLNFAALDDPPNGASDWISWFRMNAKHILYQAQVSEDYDYTNFMLLLDTELSKGEYPDAFGEDKQQIDLLTVEDFRAAFDVEGAAINLPYLHQNGDIEDSLDLLGEALDREPAVTDFYISQPGAGSYGWHFDQDDGIIYLVEGNKHFRVAGKEVGSPTVIDVILQPGDAVYVPASYYHYATGGDEQSVIWSVGFMNTEEGYAGLDQKEQDDYELLKKKTWEDIASEYQSEGSRFQPPGDL